MSSYSPINSQHLQHFKDTPKTELKILLFSLLSLCCFLIVFWVRRKCWSSSADFNAAYRCILGDKRRYTSSTSERDESVLRTLCWTQASVNSAHIKNFSILFRNSVVNLPYTVTICFLYKLSCIYDHFIELYYFI